MIIYIICDKMNDNTEVDAKKNILMKIYSKSVNNENLNIKYDFFKEIMIDIHNKFTLPQGREIFYKIIEIYNLILDDIKNLLMVNDNIAKKYRYKLWNMVKINELNLVNMSSMSKVNMLHSYVTMTNLEKITKQNMIHSYVITTSLEKITKQNIDANCVVGLETEYQKLRDENLKIRRIMDTFNKLL